MSDNWTYRVLVTGTRRADHRHRSFIRHHLLEAIGHIPIGQTDRVVVIHGDAPGVDLLVDDIVRNDLDLIRLEAYPATNFGSWPACGPRRNSHMVSLGADICLAFPDRDSRGTWDCARKAAEAGIPVILRTLPEVPDGR